MRPYKVIHVITRLDRGGSAQNTMLTAMGHDRSTFEAMVVAGMAGAQDAQGGMPATDENCRRLEKVGVPWRLITALRRRLSPLRDVRAFWDLYRVFRRERPAIVHTHTSKAGVLGRVAAWMAGVPVVVHTPHGHVFYGHFGRGASRLFLRLERALARRTTRLIALTAAERDEHLQRGVGRPEQFAVVPSGVDLERFRAVAGVTDHRLPGLDLPPDAVVVGSVGWLTPVKGHRYLVEALGRLKPSHPRLHGVIVGTGELLEELQALAVASGVGDAIRFAGLRHDVPECLAAMDVFVLPSLNEGMGRALVEAMAAGLPVVATRVGGVPALVQDRRNGLLVPPGDAAALAGALDELLRNPAWAKELGAAAGASIDARFGAAQMVRMVDAIYEQALQEASGVRRASQ
jgi:glycosyltransferase involved in cell wall biosynthesis